jgi:ABC-type nitrate/sulfonate/bicarbonate transport system ATPase subunit
MGISVVVVTHDVESAFKIGDRITVLDQRPRAGLRDGRNKFA